MTTLNVPDLRWALRQGRRATDAPVPDTRQTFEIADDFRHLIHDDADRETVRRILAWMPRGEDIAFALGYLPATPAADPSPGE